MAILFSSPRRRYGATKGRNTSVLSVLLLVLSHNVWNTLQCVTSPSHSKNPPHSPPRRTSLSEDDLSASTSASNEVFESEEAIDRAIDFEKKRDDNGGVIERPAHEEPFQACQARLPRIVMMICGLNNFYEPKLSASDYPPRNGNTLPEMLGMSKKPAEDTIIQRRMTRNLVTECCIKARCTTSYIMQTFCEHPTRVVMTTTTTMRPLIEDMRTRTAFMEPQIFEAEETWSAETHPELPELPLPPGNVPVDEKPYYPIIHYLNFTQRTIHRGDKNINQGSVSVRREDAQRRSSEQDGDRELSRPEARVQSAYPNSQTYRHHSHQQQSSGQGLRIPAVNQFPGGLVEVTGENAGKGDRAFTNSAAALHHSNHHSNQRRHHHHPSANTNDINIYQNNSEMQHNLQRQQAPRKSSVNILTSTLPPWTLIPLDPITDYEA